MSDVGMNIGRLNAPAAGGYGSHDADASSVGRGDDWRAQRGQRNVVEIYAQARTEPRPPRSQWWAGIADDGGRASAGMAFLAQRVAQEVLSPGLYHEDYPPAIAAYGRAAGQGPAGPSIRLSA